MPDDSSTVETTQEAEGPATPPFEPPAGFEFPEMLAGDRPRPRPAAYRRSLHVRRWHQTAINLGMAAGVCVVLSMLPFVRTLGFYFLPLQYLDWIGYILAAIGMIVVVNGLARRGPYVFVRDGEPTIGRVLSVRKEVMGSGQNMRFRFGVEVEFLNPFTGEMENRTFPTRPLDSDHTRYSVAVRTGEYTTVVVLPGRPARAVLWGLSEADPDHKFLLRDGRPVQPRGLLLSVGVAGAFFVAGGAVLGGIYAVQFLAPISAPSPAMAVGTAGGAALGLAGAWWFMRGWNESAGVVKRAFRVLFIGVLPGVALGALVVMLLNAAMDRSPPTYRDIQITEVWQTTHHLIFSTYDFEYVPVGSADKERYPATAGTIGDFDQTRAGVVQIRSGGLGMPWISDLCPCVIVPIEDNAPDPAHGFLLRYRPKSAPADAPERTRRFAFKIMLHDGTLLEPSSTVAAMALAFAQKQTHGVEALPARP